MPERLVGVADVASGAGVVDYRTRERTVASATVVEQYVVPERLRVGSRHMAGGHRNGGQGSVSHHLFAIFNAAGSTVTVAVRRLSIQHDQTTAQTALRKAYASRLTVLPTGGTILGKVDFDTAKPSNASVTVRGAISADGGSFTAITATAGGPAYGQSMSRLREVSGQWRAPDDSLIPVAANKHPVLLGAGEGLLVTHAEAGTTASSYIINCVWEEFTLP